MWTDSLTTKEAQYSDEAVRALKSRPWAAPLIQKIERAGGISSAVMPLLLEARVAYALSQRGVNAEYEYSPIPGGKTIDFRIRGNPEWLIEVFSLRESQAVKDATAQEGILGESAKTANLTQLKALLTYCREQKGRIQCVVVYSVNRFAREKYDHYLLRAQLQRLGVTLRSATEPIDDSSTGKLMEGIVSAFAQFDNDVRSERTVEGMKARLKRGGWTSKAPLGYLSRRDTMVRKALVPDPERGPFVTHSFELYSSGLYNKNQVLRIVTKMGLRSCSSKALTPQSFGAVLTKPIYAGRIVVRDWDVTTVANFEPLVTSDVFDRVQALLSGRRSPVSPKLRSNPDFPLRHFVRCGGCGRPLTASWSRGRNQRYAYYRCQNRACRAVNVRQDVAEKLFFDY